MNDNKLEKFAKLYMPQGFWIKRLEENGEVPNLMEDLGRFQREKNLVNWVLKDEQEFPDDRGVKTF